MTIEQKHKALQEAIDQFIIKYGCQPNCLYLWTNGDADKKLPRLFDGITVYPYDRKLVSTHPDIETHGVYACQHGSLNRIFVPIQYQPAIGNNNLDSSKRVCYNHDYVEYVGLQEVFKYCRLCDVKESKQ